MNQLFLLITSKEAVLYYLFILLTEVLTKYGINKEKVKGKNYVLSTADIMGVVSVVYIIYICFTKVWWSFAPLLLTYVIIYKTFHIIYKNYLFYSKKFDFKKPSIEFVGQKNEKAQYHL